MAIKFNKHVSEAVLHSPLKDFALDSQTIENRADPLTGWTGIIRTGRQFWQHMYNTDENLLLEIGEKTRERCFFCPEKVNESTPRYPEEFIPEGRITVGEACLFPNLFAFHFVSPQWQNDNFYYSRTIEPIFKKITSSRGSEGQGHTFSASWYAS